MSVEGVGVVMRVMVASPFPVALFNTLLATKFYSRENPFLV
jgi:hypothetical protein